MSVAAANVRGRDQHLARIGADGRVVSYFSRRFLPPGSSMPLVMGVTVTQGDRLDLIAARTFGDPEQYWRICDANDALDPFERLQRRAALVAQEKLELVRLHMDAADDRGFSADRPRAEFQRPSSARQE